MSASSSSKRQSVLVVGPSHVEVSHDSRGELRLAGSGSSNVAAGLSRLGHDVTFLTSLAPDDDGMRIIHQLLAAGVRLTPASFGAVRTGWRTGPAASFERGQETWWLPPVESIPIPDVLHIAADGAFALPGATRVRELARRARQECKFISVHVDFGGRADPDLGESLLAFSEYVELSDLLHLSSRDALWLHPGQNLDDIRNIVLGSGARTVAMTHPDRRLTIASRKVSVDAPIAGLRGDSRIASLIHLCLVARRRKALTSALAQMPAYEAIAAGSPRL